VTRVDIAALLVIGLAALAGFRRGLIVGALSLGGLVAGAYVGAKIAPGVLRGHASIYPPLVTLGGAVVGSGIGQFAAVTVGRSVRRALQIPFVRVFDNIGGLLLGGLTGAAFVWVIGAVLLYIPADGQLRREVQRSEIAGRLTSALPPARIIGALARVDPFQSFAGPAAGVGAGDPALLRAAPVQAAGRSVVRIVGVACGVGIEGSGWVVAKSLVVTNAHVVAGIGHPFVDRQDGRVRRASVVGFDKTNDLALLRVPGLGGRPLALAQPESGIAIAVLGFPGNGPFTAVPGRLGATSSVLARDAYGQFPVARGVTAVRARIQPGDSGGPVVDAGGRVRGVVFARRTGYAGGYAVPTQYVAALLRARRAGAPVASDCVG
jgi:trypsin-like peptidase/colicin V production protein